MSQDFWSEIEDIHHEDIDDADHRTPLSYQCDVHGDLTISLDELFSSVERVNKPEEVPVAPLFV